jgi:hypothetical protein
LDLVTGIGTRSEVQAAQIWSDPRVRRCDRLIAARHRLRKKLVGPIGFVFSRLGCLQIIRASIVVLGHWALPGVSFSFVSPDYRVDFNNL